MTVEDQAIRIGQWSQVEAKMFWILVNYTAYDTEVPYRLINSLLIIWEKLVDNEAYQIIKDN